MQVLSSVKHLSNILFKKINNLRNESTIGSYQVYSRAKTSKHRVNYYIEIFSAAYGKSTFIVGGGQVYPHSEPHILSLHRHRKIFIGSFSIEYLMISFIYPEIGICRLFHLP